MSPLSLSYDNPVTAVLLRTLAWELFVAEKHLRVQDVVTNQVQAARKELGLEPLKGGAAHDFIQGLRSGSKPDLSPRDTPPKPVDPSWHSAWRLLRLPRHHDVRQLSEQPVFTRIAPVTVTQAHVEFKVTLRNPALPTLHVFVGTQLPASNTFGVHRGLYFLRLVDSLYIGKTNEFDVRLVQQQKKAPLWWIFVSPELSIHTFPKDALEAAEAILISLWNEVSILSNQNRGVDQQPAFHHLQQAILMVEAASGVLLWLVRDQKIISIPLLENIPFKPWGGKNWPDCYMRVPSQD